MNRIRRLTTAALASAAALALSAMLGPAAASAADYVPGQVIVGYAQTPNPAVAADVARQTGIPAAQPVAPAPAPNATVLSVPRGLSVGQAIKRLRHQHGVAYAVTNFIAHAAYAWIHDEPGRRS